MIVATLHHSVVTIAMYYYLLLRYSTTEWMLVHVGIPQLPSPMNPYKNEGIDYQQWKEAGKSEGVVHT